MTRLRAALPSGRWLVLIDLLLAVWVAAWIWLGVALGEQVSGLRQLSTTAGRAGVAVDRSGRLLSQLGSIPSVGGQVKGIAEQVEQAGQSAEQSARVSRHSAEQLSWMLALAIALIPSMPVLGFYVPLRVLAARDRRGLRRLWLMHGEDPEFRRVLAGRALAALPYDQLRRSAGSAPWEDFARGDYDRLAEAELRRCGVDPASAPAARL